MRTRARWSFIVINQIALNHFKTERACHYASAPLRTKTGIRGLFY